MTSRNTVARGQHTLTRDAATCPNTDLVIDAIFGGSEASLAYPSKPEQALLSQPTQKWATGMHLNSRNAMRQAVT